MRAGELRHRVEIQHPVAGAPNAYGEAAIAWTKLRTAWAAVEPLSGRELVEAQAVSARASARVRMRYHGDITTDMRVLWRDRTLNIEAVLDVDGRARETHLITSEVADGA